MRIASTRRMAFTLIELVVVLVILAAVAALLVPRLGFLKGQADSATAAAGSAQIVSNLETYKLSVGGYPMGMDSLLTSGGGGVYTGLWQHAAGPSFFGLRVDLTASTVGAGGTGTGYAQSFGHAFSPPAGGYYLYDHDAAATDFTNSATVLRTFATASSAPVATATGADLIKAAGYPTGTLPTGVKLIALGIGPNNAAIGTTMASAPRHSAQTSDFYGRYIAIFAIYDSGKGGELKTVVDSFGNTIDSNVTDYKNASPTKNPTPTP